jgi:hypothetical protein
MSKNMAKFTRQFLSTSEIIILVSTAKSTGFEIAFLWVEDC